jgi:integrase/recombinase XerC
MSEPVQAPMPGQSQDSPDLPDLALAYLHHVAVERRLGHRTVELYTQDLLKLHAHCTQASIDLLQVQPLHMRKWVMHMHAQGRSPRGIALILSGWRGFYTWAGARGHVALNPLDGVRAPKVPKPLPKALPVDDAVQLAAHTDDQADAWTEARDALAVELLYGSGLRMAELLCLDVRASQVSTGHIDAQDQTATVLGKGQKQRTVPVGQAALQALQHWLALRNTVFAIGAATSDALFINRRGQRLSPQWVRKQLKARAAKAGLQSPVHPHMLRHSFASHVLQSSGDLRGVQELLGHANIGTTQVYTRLDFQHLAKVYDQAHPRAKLPG